jgi:hypothetical protein
MKMDTVLVTIALAAAYALAGSGAAHGQTDAAVPDARPRDDTPNDSALTEMKKAHAEATSRLNERVESDPLERNIPWTERGGAAGHVQRHGTPAPLRPSRR